MYYDFWIDLPANPGKYVFETRNNITYVKYEYDRTYDPVKKITYPKRVTIGKASDDRAQIQPNHNFLTYFPDVELPIAESKLHRSSCLRAGAFIVIQKIIREYGLEEILGRYFNKRQLGLFLDLAIYTIITENNAAQYYPDYAYCHPLMSEDMKIYSDSTVSEFLHSITSDQSTGFLNDWNGSRSKQEKIYISYDSTNKNSQAGDVEMVEFGKAKEDLGLPILNYSIGYDVKKREPLFYEEYPGSIVDISQLRIMIDKAKGYGYEHIGFILDRGYFSKYNIAHMDQCGYEFIIMVKGMAKLVSSLVLTNKGTFENKRSCYTGEYGDYGKTIKAKLYETDTKERYFHIYHNISKEAAERVQLEEKLKTMKNAMMKRIGKPAEFSGAYKEYFYLHYDEDKIFQYPEENTKVIEREIDLCGYFVIVTSEEMTAKEALQIYKSRDYSEKLFRTDKTFLGDSSLRVHSSESTSAKIFIEFIALIIRNRIYTSLKDEMERIDKKPNYMTVPAALRELEKIEMTRQIDNIYRLDHAITATQASILKAFGLSKQQVEYQIRKISDILKAVNQKHDSKEK